MTFNEMMLDEQLHIIDNLRKQLRDELNKNSALSAKVDFLLNLCDKLSHETDEQTETIDELNETIDEQAHEINALYKEIDQQKTEINRLKMIDDLKDDERAAIVSKNMKLKQTINALYGIKNQLADDNNNLRQTIKAYEKLF